MRSVEHRPPPGPVLCIYTRPQREKKWKFKVNDLDLAQNIKGFSLTHAPSLHQALCKLVQNVVLLMFIRLLCRRTLNWSKDRKKRGTKTNPHYVL